jgi:hypothetical protein
MSKSRQIHGSLRDSWDTSFPSSSGFATVPKKLKSSGVKRLMERALWAQGLRKKLIAGKRRHEFSANHSFRKYFHTSATVRQLTCSGRTTTWSFSWAW